jgi:hypothetical protein
MWFRKYESRRARLCLAMGALALSLIASPEGAFAAGPSFGNGGLGAGMASGIGKGFGKSFGGAFGKGLGANIAPTFAAPKIAPSFTATRVAPSAPIAGPGARAGTSAVTGAANATGPAPKILSHTYERTISTPRGSYSYSRSGAKALVIEDGSTRQVGSALGVSRSMARVSDGAVRTGTFARARAEVASGANLQANAYAGATARVINNVPQTTATSGATISVP